MDNNPLLDSAQKALMGIDPAQLDTATAIAYGSAVAQLATAYATSAAAKDLYTLAEAAVADVSHQLRIANNIDDLIAAIKGRHQ